MRILWIGDAGTSSGFSRVTHEIGERLVAKGHDVHVLASMHAGDPVETTLKLYPASLDMSDFKGRKRIVPLLLQIQPDAVLMIEDPWTVASLLWNEHDPQGLLRKGPVRPIAYMPIDGEPVPAEWQKLSATVTSVAMSKFGQRQMINSTLIPHGVDTAVFHPVEDGPIVTHTGKPAVTRRECKEAFGFDPDGFLALRVDRNSWRKDFGSTWKALIPVMARHSDVYAHFHCAENDPAGGPILPALFSRRPDLAPRFRTPAGYGVRNGWPLGSLAALYNAADVFVSTSMGEGFGLTIAEALACGTPVIAQDCSAISEVAEEGAILIPPGPKITAPGGHDLRLAQHSEFATAIETVYRMSEEGRRELGRLGRDHIVSEYSWDRAADAFEVLATT